MSSHCQVLAAECESSAFTPITPALEAHEMLVRSKAAFLFFGIDFGFEPLAPGEGPEAPPEAEAPPTLACSPPSPLTGDANPSYGTTT